MYNKNERLFNELLYKFKVGTTNLLFISILVLMIIPPIGVLWFVLLGWYTLIRRLIKKVRFPVNVSTLLFLGITLSATVALFTTSNFFAPFIIPMPILILGYYGVYVFIFDEVKQASVWFHSYIAGVIVGGLYIFLFSQVVRWFKLKVSFPLNDLLGRALLGSPPTPRLYGSTFNPNFAAYLILLMSGVCLAYLLQAIKERAYGMIGLFVILLAIAWAAILDTGSRSAFIGMLILFFLALARLSWKSALVAIVVVLLRVHWFIQLIPRKGIIDLSYSNRIIIWKNSLKIFKTHPIFGVSPGGFSVFYKQLTHKYVPHSHDIFIAFLTEYGVVGELVFLTFFVTMGIFYFRLVFNPLLRNQFNAFVYILTLPIIIITGLLDHPLFSPQVALPTVVLLAFFHRYIINTTKSRII